MERQEPILPEQYQAIEEGLSALLEIIHEEVRRITDPSYEKIVEEPLSDELCKILELEPPKPDARAHAREFGQDLIITNLGKLERFDREVTMLRDRIRVHTSEPSTEDAELEAIHARAFELLQNALLNETSATLDRIFLGTCHIKHIRTLRAIVDALQAYTVMTGSVDEIFETDE